MESLQYLSNSAGEKTAVIIPIEEYQKMQEELDEFYCIKEYESAKEENLTFRSFDEAVVDIEKERTK